MYIRDKNRYLVEHYVMPNAVYANGLALPFQLMVDPGKTMVGIYEAVREDTNGVINVDERDFSETYKVYEREEDRLLIVRVAMPVPVAVYQCRALYICFSKRDGKSLYFTSEMNADGDFMLCAWARDRAHLNFNIAPDTADGEFQLISQLFWEISVDGYKERFEGLRAG